MRDLTQLPFLCSHFPHDTLRPDIRTDTLIIRPKSSDSAGNFIPGPSARTGCGEERQGGEGVPYHQPFSKTKVRATSNSVLLGDSNLRFPPRSFGGGAFRGGQRGAFRLRHVYGAVSTEVRGQDPHYQPHFSRWKPYGSPERC